ncbi:hypothetical protein DYB28_008783 [Aphanomyces astaci]|uniref:Uncharacterized protein n=1 Tax=Aphanomyces astaci TaxID=112090 RepID=A0A9X8E785_APHAT|nr:hypothetical protein DYB28_008783 [Aphanomyces astaci]
MARKSKDRAQMPKAAATAPTTASSETEEEVPVTEPPLVPVVGGTTDELPAVEESKSEEVRKTMEELAKANKVTGSTRAASMTWDESRRRYGGQTMGPNRRQRSPMPRSEQKKRRKLELSYVRNDGIDRTVLLTVRKKKRNTKKNSVSKLSGGGSTKPIVPQRRSVSTMPKWRVRPMIDGCWTPPCQAVRDGDLFQVDHRRQAAEDGGPTSTQWTFIGGDRCSTPSDHLYGQNLPSALGEEARDI